MKPVAGLWIDHRKATVVILSDEGEVTKQILSKVEKQNGRLDGVRSVQPYESLLVSSDDKQLRDFSGHLDVFYKEDIRILFVQVCQKCSMSCRPEEKGSIGIPEGKIIFVNGDGIGG